MLEARSIVGHDIQRSREVVRVVAVTLFALVRALEVAEVGCCAFVREGTFVDAGDCRDVVTAGGYGGVPGVEVVGEHHGL